MGTTIRTRASMRRYTLMAGLLAMAAGGCVAQEKYDEALRISAGLQSQLDEAKAARKEAETALQTERAKSDRLALEKADQALYRAKASGRNCVVAWEQED